MKLTNEDINKNHVCNDCSILCIRLSKKAA